MQTSEKKVFNILQITTKLPVGGVENMMVKVVKGYDRERYNVIVCCIMEGGAIADELEKSGFRVVVLNKMQSHRFDWGAVKAIYDLIKKENIHILRTHQYHANLYGRIAGALARVPVIVSSTHTIYVYRGKSKIHRRILNFILSLFSDKVVAVSNAVADDIKKQDRVDSEKVKVIYNGVDIDKFCGVLSKDEARERLGLPQDAFIIGTVGRLTKEKGHKYLIDAVSKLGDVHLVIAGDGPLMEELKDLSRRLSVDCVFMGRVDPEEVPLILNSFDLFCFPSLWEGFGTALVEAMSAGLPVVASDIASLREVAGEAGVFARPRDSEHLAEALSVVVKDPSYRKTLGEKAAERAGLFSMKNTVSNYEALFNEVLLQKGML